MSFRRVLALAIYGLVVFPSAVGVIDLAAISISWMVENHWANPVLALLADTFQTQSFCRREKKGKLKSCLQLLNPWLFNHIYGRQYQLGTRFDTVHHPIQDFVCSEGSKPQQTSMNRDEWAQMFGALKDDSVWEKLAWWESEQVVYCCGAFPNVPLIGSRGCINYNPAVVHRQFAYTQDVPSETAVRVINFYYDEPQKEEIMQEVRNAWTQVVRKGRFELGKRIVTTTEEYRMWLREGTGGANLSFGPHNPLRTNNLQEVDELLTKQLEDKKAELEKREEMSKKRLEDLAISQEKDGRKRQKEAETSTELKRLKKENAKLKGAMSEAREQAEENKAKAHKHQARLLRAVKEKDALEKKLEELQSPSDLQQQISEMTKKLEERSWELAAIMDDNAQNIRDLIEQLNRQAECEHPI